MSKQNLGSPYAGLGKRLRTLRTRAKETLAESAGAVEIEVGQLAGFELGSKRPSQDVLLLLISHFNAGDTEAMKLWELAGYNSEQMPEDEPSFPQPEAKDNKILFTDVVDVMVNNYGVVMNFMQSGGHTGAPQSVARVGMSREHAKSVLKILQITLAQTEQNSPAASSSAPDNNFSTGV